MTIVFSLFWWLIFGLLPTLTVLIPIYFVLKSKDINSYWWHLSISALVGFVVYFFIGSTPFLFSELESASIDHVEMIKAGEPTFSWYLSKAIQSSTGAFACIVISSIWWLALVKPRSD